MAGKKDNIELICDVGELVHLFRSTNNLSDFLAQVVRVVAFHMRAAVCSIYFYDDRSEHLVMVANQGLSPDAVGRTRLHITEGITGNAFKERRIINEGRSRLSPYWKAIPNINEEHYESFLAVPIMRGLERIGVLVIQDPQPDYFTPRDTRALHAISLQLATAIQNANEILGVQGRMPESLESPRENAPKITFIKGKSPVAGVVEGEIVHITGKSGNGFEPPLYEPVKPEDLARFDRALQRTLDQLDTLQVEMEEAMGDIASLIFTAHLLILKDDAFSGEIRRKIEGGEGLRRAICEVVNQYIRIFSSSSNPRTQEKIYDIKDLGHRLMANLLDEADTESDYHNTIIVTDELLPSELVKLAAQKAQAVCIVNGAQAAHISILARSLEMPILFAENEGLLQVADRTPAILDGTAGIIFFHPDEGIRLQYSEAIRERRELNHDAGARLHEETWTQDRERIHILANVNLLNDARVARSFKAEGIGLYRSEFPFIVRNTFPSEEEQVHIYQRLFQAMEGREVILRTLDVGGDKYLPYHEIGRENNPFLGLRAIRFTLGNPEIMISQVRAMLRAAGDSPVSIMFPFVSSLDDFRACRRLVDRSLEELSREDIPYQPKPKLGIMVEVPSCLEVLPEIAEEAHFLCIGTNDLIQYLLAVDRTNEKVSPFYVAHHPSVLRAIHRVSQVGLQSQCPVSVCGDMASDPALSWFLAGIGVRSLSMDPRQIGRVQKALESGTLKEMVAFAEEMLKAATIAKTTELVKDLQLRLAES